MKIEAVKPDTSYNTHKAVKPVSVKPQNAEVKITDTGSENKQDKNIVENNITDRQIDLAIEKVNNKFTDISCAYSYDEKTKRISIKVIDNETKELVREIPSEKSLEMFAKFLELAGFMVDERR